MKPIIFNRFLLTLMLMLSIGSAGASFTVKVGENSTLTFEVNEDDTTTVTLIKCECGAWYGRKFYWEEVTVIPDEVTVNGVAKTVTQINSKQSTKPVFYDMVEVVFPSTVKRIDKTGFIETNSEGAPIYVMEKFFNFEKVKNLESLETYFSFYGTASEIPAIKNLTISNGVKLSENFPYKHCYNLQYDASSTVYDLRGGCLMKKGDNETVVTILRQPEVTVPASVKRIAHSMPHYNGEVKTHVTFEPGSQLETINGYLTYCIFDSWPATVKTIYMSDYNYGRDAKFEQDEFLSFTLPSNYSSIGIKTFSGAIFHHFDWGENPVLIGGLLDCFFMEDIKLPDWMTTTNGAFQGATFYGNFELSESFEGLQRNEFNTTYFSKGFSLPDHITKLPSSCFKNARFGDNLNLPESVTEIGDSCFYNCQFDTRLTLPERISYLPPYSFYASRFVNGLDLPEAIKLIPEGAFQRAKFNGTLTLPDGLLLIEKNAFANVEFNNTTLVMPPNVTVDKDAFVNCQIYKMVWTGDTFDGLGSFASGERYSTQRYEFNRYSIIILDLGTSTPTNNAFTYFPYNMKVYTHCKTPPAVSCINYVVPYGYPGPLYVPRGSKATYEKKSPWCYYQNIVEFDEAEKAPFVGDVNGDGNKDVTDVTALINDILTGKAEQNALLDDVNEDSNYDIRDVTTLINLILK